MKRRIRKRSAFIALVALFCPWFSVEMVPAATFIGVPFNGARGNSFAREPFALEELNVMSSRYQQIYDASAFSSIANGGGWITRIDLRPDEEFGHAFGVTLPSVEILLGVSQRSPDGLSTRFADNFSGTATDVIPRGNLFIGAAPVGDFIHIPLATPFFYNPANGNLLLEIRNYQRLPPDMPIFRAGPMDAFDVPGDTVSRLFAYNVNATVGTADTLGLTTYFVVTPIPEPSTWGLLVLGAGILGLWHRRRNQFNR